MQLINAEIMKNEMAASIMIGRCPVVNMYIIDPPPDSDG